MRYAVNCPTCGVEVSFVRLAGLVLPGEPRDPDAKVERCPNGHGFTWKWREEPRAVKE